MVWHFWLVFLFYIDFTNTLPHHYKDEKTSVDSNSSAFRNFRHDLHHSLKHGVHQSLKKSESVLHNLQTKLHTLHDNLITIKQKHQDAIHHGKKPKDWFKHSNIHAKVPIPIHEIPFHVKDYDSQKTGTEPVGLPEKSVSGATNLNSDTYLISAPLTKPCHNGKKTNCEDTKKLGDFRPINPNIINLINTSIVFNTVIEKQDGKGKCPISIPENSNLSVNVQLNNDNSIKSMQQNNSYNLHLPSATVKTTTPTSHMFGNVSDTPTHSTNNTLPGHDKSSIFNSSSEKPQNSKTQDSSPSEEYLEATFNASDHKIVGAVFNNSEENFTFQDTAETFPESTGISNGPDYSFTVIATDRPIKFPEEWDATSSGRTEEETSSTPLTPRTPCASTVEENEDSIDVRFGGFGQIQSKNEKPNTSEDSISKTRLEHLTKLLSDQNFKDTIIQYYNKNNETRIQPIGNLASTERSMRENRSDSYRHKGHGRSRRFVKVPRTVDTLKNKSKISKTASSEQIKTNTGSDITKGFQKNERKVESKERRSRKIKRDLADAAAARRRPSDIVKTTKASEAAAILALLTDSQEHQQDDPIGFEEEVYYEDDYDDDIDDDNDDDNDGNISDMPKDGEYYDNSDEASFGELITLASKHKSRKEKLRQINGQNKTNTQA